MFVVFVLMLLICPSCLLIGGFKHMSSVIAVPVVTTLSAPFVGTDTDKLFFCVSDYIKALITRVARLSKVKLPDVSVMPQTSSAAPKGGRCSLIQTDSSPALFTLQKKFKREIRK